MLPTTRMGLQDVDSEKSDSMETGMMSVRPASRNRVSLLGRAESLTSTELDTSFKRRRMFVRENSSALRQNFVPGMSGSAMPPPPSSIAPGVDPNREPHWDAAYEQLVNDVNIVCIDYDKTQISVREHINNASVTSFLEEPRAPHSKVRWLNIQGVSFDVIKAIARKFHLHPLSVEDCLHTPQRIKCDFYENHLYVSMVLLALDQQPGENPNDNFRTPLRKVTRKVKPLPMHVQPNTKLQAMEKMMIGGHRADTFNTDDIPVGNAAEPQHPSLKTSKAARASFAAKKHSSTRLPESVQVEVYIEQANMFLLPNGILITMFSREGSAVTDNIVNYIHKSGTLLRDSEDASLLLHHMIDGIVDYAIPVVSHYADIVSELEARVVTGQPRAGYTTELHLLQSDLKGMRKLMAPTQHLINTLRMDDSGVEARTGGWEKVHDTYPKVLAQGDPRSRPGSSEQMQPPQRQPSAPDLIRLASVPDLIRLSSVSAMMEDSARVLLTSGLDQSKHRPSREQTDRAHVFTPHGLPSLPMSQMQQAPTQHLINTLRKDTTPDLWQGQQGAPQPGGMASKASIWLTPQTRAYLADVSDHINTVVESIDALNDRSRDLINLIFNMFNYRNMRSMQLLSTMSTIFLPITFLAAVYGMNFDILPELHWHLGYLYFWMMVIGIVIGTLVSFRLAGFFSM